MLCKRKSLESTELEKKYTSIHTDTLILSFMMKYIKKKKILSKKYTKTTTKNERVVQH